MLFDVGEDIDFVDCAFFKFFVFFKLVDGYDFDGVLLFVVVIDGSIYFSVDSWADLFVEDIVLYIFYHPFWIIIIQNQ